ncbi:MAG: hypothetical protein KGR26_05485 [Cyanobacteria bacterium REEB65]|nr:hypothetical protein [Cyanobacteria bacterium REEB65]
MRAGAGRAFAFQAIRIAALGGGACAALAACGSLGPAPGPGGLVANFGFTGPAVLAQFDNPARQESSGFGYGQWAISGGALEQVKGAADNDADHLRYIGSAFGSHGGLAPHHYRVEVDVSAYQAVDSPQVAGAPTGTLALLPYYKDPTHYVLLDASGHTNEAWMVDGYRPAGDVWPASAKVWSQWNPDSVGLNQVVRWTAEVDTDHHSVHIWVDGQDKGTVTSALVDNSPHYIALAANGNYVAYHHLALYDLDRQLGWF